MRHLRIVVLAWLIAGCGVVVGRMIGSLFGRQGAFLGAVVAGTLAILLAVQLMIRVRWLDPERRRGGSIGALCGFALAAAAAGIPAGRPLIQLLTFVLVGAGLLLGAGPGAAR
jgi:hypothetical protein